MKTKVTVEIKKISEGILAIDLALYLVKSKTLVIADTHIGYEESLNKQGILLPRFQFKEIGQKLEKVIRTIKENGFVIEKIVINGDIKHEFGRISEQEWRHTLQLIDFLSRNSKEVILIKGNHDTVLGPIAEKRSIIVKEYLVIDDILIMHGDKLLKKDLEDKIKKTKKESKSKFNEKINTIIIGHEHPAVSLGSVARFEKYKCFLIGKWNNKELIVQPSLNQVTEGTDILKDSLFSPFLKGNRNFNDFKVIVAGDDEKFYDFGKVKKLK